MTPVMAPGSWYCASSPQWLTGILKQSKAVINVPHIMQHSINSTLTLGVLGMKSARQFWWVQTCGCNSLFRFNFERSQYENHKCKCENEWWLSSIQLLQFEGVGIVHPGSLCHMTGSWQWLPVTVEQNRELINIIINTCDFATWLYQNVKKGCLIGEAHEFFHGLVFGLRSTVNCGMSFVQSTEFANYSPNSPSIFMFFSCFM